MKVGFGRQRNRKAKTAAEPVSTGTVESVVLITRQERGHFGIKLQLRTATSAIENHVSKIGSDWFGNQREQTCGQTEVGRDGHNGPIMRSFLHIRD